MSRKRLLITGGAGFIGANFVHYWKEKYPDSFIVIVDALTYAGNRKNLEPLGEKDDVKFIHGDIRDEVLIEKLLNEDKLDTIVHFAAESHVDRSILGPDAFIETNIIGTHNLLKVARKVWLNSDKKTEDHRFHHVSTDEVYGSLDVDAPAFQETTPYDPSSPYSASKASSDHLVRAYHRTFGLSVTISNCSNNYGMYQHDEKFIPTIIRSCRTQTSIPVYGDGKNVRDWLFVEDHCSGLDAVINHGKPGETYNIGGNDERTNISVVEHICNLMDELRPEQQQYSKLITYVTDRPGHDRRYAINSEKIMSELNWQPKENFESGIRKTVNWYLNR